MSELLMDSPDTSPCQLFNFVEGEKKITPKTLGRENLHEHLFIIDLYPLLPTPASHPSLPTAKCVNFMAICNCSPGLACASNEIFSRSIKRGFR